MATTLTPTARSAEDFAPPISPSNRINVGPAERWASLAGGGVLVLLGLKQGSLRGLLLALTGGALVYRGATGHCPVFQSLGVDTAAPHQQLQPVHIAESLTVNKPRGDVYAVWRDVENLPRFMHHLEQVKHLDTKRSYWVAQVPQGLGSIDWEAEVVEDRPSEAIAWRSLPGATVHNAGTVRFKDAPGGRGTEIQVTIEYRPPAGHVGKAVAGLFNDTFAQLIKEDVRRFKHMMEAGEIPTVKGQPSGR